VSRQLTLAFAVVLTALTARGTASQPVPAAEWTPSPAYVALFAPAGAPPGAYSAYVSDASLDTVVRRLQQDFSASAPTGAWVAEAVVPFEAFGQSGRYDRSALARLYGASRARVARGPRIEDGQVTEAWTLISPFPDPMLRRLRSGVLLIVLKVRPPEGHRGGAL